MPHPLALYYESSFCFDSLSYNNHRVSSQPDTHTPTIRSQYPFVYKTNSFFPAALLRLLIKENDDQHTVRAPTPFFLCLFPSSLLSLSSSLFHKPKNKNDDQQNSRASPPTPFSLCLGLCRCPGHHQTRPQYRFVRKTNSLFGGASAS